LGAIHYNQKGCPAKTLRHDGHKSNRKPLHIIVFY
jgi:hypothetical protein